jgi:hypothetical protein
MVLVIFHPAAFVLASLGEHSEYEHLEKILLDAICTEPVEYENGNIKSKDEIDKYENTNQKIILRLNMSILSDGEKNVY